MPLGRGTLSLSPTPGPWPTVVAAESPLQLPLVVVARAALLRLRGVLRGRERERGRPDRIAVLDQRPRVGPVADAEPGQVGRELRDPRRVVDRRPAGQIGPDRRQRRGRHRRRTARRQQQ